ncbi:MAG: ferritin [Gemmatimonadetes bacterium]|jgi:ferritin|nr:ferritin [Gemmatimonadota bacterium]MBK6779666.1 ferritin [Gemmatimonadota bacterium]MBK7716357.1 ferritin [Gemmatimonadota bacterium]MBK7785533.1 ferritin [Gemmatimonadota bacterium]MBK7923589.1 ferritin [Gemmatimonadota bacterium]
MTPSKGLQQAMNDQIRKEFESAYIYLSMAAWMEDQNLPGFAAWLRLQAREESTHAMKIFDHLIDRGCRVELQPLAGPPTDFKSSLHIFQEVKKHEEKVTKSINDLYGLALDDRDYASQVFIQWFITEQVEEEKNSSQVLESVRRVGDNQAALVMLDRELGSRTSADEDGEE